MHLFWHKAIYLCKTDISEVARLHGRKHHKWYNYCFFSLIFLISQLSVSHSFTSYLNHQDANLAPNSMTNPPGKPRRMRTPLADWNVLDSLAAVTPSAITPNEIITWKWKVPKYGGFTQERATPFRVAYPLSQHETELAKLPPKRYLSQAVFTNEQVWKYMLGMVNSWLITWQSAIIP